jgi:Flp pilus assembly pilin Flp
VIDRVVVWALTLKTKLGSERGQDMIEYAMLGGLIALAIIAVGVLGFKGAITDMFTGIGHCIDFNSGTTCNPF